MKNKPIFNWDEENKIASCILTDGEKVYTGIAKCHPEDFDMMSEKTGCEIALRRAKIKVLQEYKRELNISLKALNHLYGSMKHSKNFNKNSYEIKMLQRRIRMIKFDLDTTKEIIDMNQKNLKEYIDQKENFYQLIRKRRMLKSAENLDE